MTLAPLAVFAVLLLAMILSGLFVINIIVANYIMAMLCLAVICALGLALGMFVGSLGTKLDATGQQSHLTGLDLSEDTLGNLREIPEGTIASVGVATVPDASTSDTGSACDEDTEEPKVTEPDNPGQSQEPMGKSPLDATLPTIEVVAEPQASPSEEPIESPSEASETDSEGEALAGNESDPNVASIRHEPVGEGEDA